MDFFENAVSKAKDAFDVAYKKTNEVVYVQKQKFDIASIEGKREKEYATLGKLYFEQIKDTEIENPEIKQLVDEIKNKNEKIKVIKDEINSAKNKRICPQCSAAIDNDAAFCSVCGAKVIIDG